MKKKLAVPLILALGLALCVAGSAWTEEEATAAAVVSAEEAQKEKPAAATGEGLQVWIDEDTGELRMPTAKEAARMTSRMQSSLGKRQPFEPRVFADKSGATAVEVDPSLYKYTVVRIAEDGSVVEDYAQGLDQAAELLETTPANAREEE